MSTKFAKRLLDTKNLGAQTRVYRGLKTSSWSKIESIRLAVFLLLFGAGGYLTFSTFAASNATHPDGSLIQFVGSPSVYMKEGGILRGIYSEDALFSQHYGYGGNSRANVIVEDANTPDASLPKAGPNNGIGFRAGTLITTPGAGVWAVVDSGNGNYSKWGVVSQQVFYDLGYNYNQVLSVPANELPPDSPNYITGYNHPGGQFVNDGGIVYMIGWSGKYRVADPSVLATYPFPIYNATAGDDSLPTLGFLPFHEGSLVKGSNTSVWMMGCSSSGVQGVCPMQKHGFTDENTFTTLGYNFGQVVGGGDADIAAITTGSYVTATAPPPPPPPPPTSTGTNPTGWLDVPADTSYPYPILSNGSLISGWANDKDTHINGVQIYIDGTLRGNATLGFNDGPACATTLGSGIDCPNTGWQYSFNGTNLGLAPGTHTVHFVATDKDSPTPHTYKSLDHNFTFGNTNPNNPPAQTPPPPTGPPPTSTGTAPTGWLDVPADTSYPYPILSNGSVLKGWAVDKETLINGVQVYIDGNLQPNNANASIGYSRTDVCNTTGTRQYDGRPGCPNVGWQWTLNTTGLAPGTHTVHFVATDRDSPTPHTYMSLDHNFQFGNTNPNNPPAQTPPPPTGPPIGTTPPPPPCLPNNSQCNPLYKWKNPSGSIDTPLASSKVSGVVNIAGWAMDNDKTAESFIAHGGVSVSVDGNPVGTASYGNIWRGDACATVSAPGCPNVGYSLNWNSASIFNGNHEIEVTITDSDPGGAHSTTLRRVVTTDNQLKPSGAITYPLNFAKIDGQRTIKGWAFDNTVRPEHAITSVKISVNGAFVGYAETFLNNDTKLTGLCSQYQNPPGCPNVGWQFNLDTNAYAAGTILSVKATITDADSPPSTNTVGVTYISSNGSATNCKPGYTGTPPLCIPLPTPTGTGATSQYQVIYAYPHEMTAPNLTEVGRIPAVIKTFQGWLKSNSGGGVYPDAPNGIQLNISSDPKNIQTIQLPGRTDQYLAAARAASGWTPDNGVDISGSLMPNVDADLGLTSPTNVKYLVFIDGYYPDAYCGRGGGSYANWLIRAVNPKDPDPKVVTPPIACEESGIYIGGPMPASSFQNLGPLHEIFHTLGVLPSCANGYDFKDSGGHIIDPTDLMTPVFNEGKIPVLDTQHNSYYGPTDLQHLSSSCLSLTSTESMKFFNKL